MAWIRCCETLKGRRLAHLQWRDDLGEVHSKSLKTDNPAVAQTYLRAFERTHVDARPRWSAASIRPMERRGGGTGLAVAS